MGLSDATDSEVCALLRLITPDNEALLERWCGALREAGGIYSAMDAAGLQQLARGTMALIHGSLFGTEISDHAALRYVDPPPYRAQPLDEFVLAGMLVDRCLRDYLGENADDPEIAATAVSRVDPVMAAAITRVVRLRQSRAGTERLLVEVERGLSRGTDARAAFADAAERVASELGAALCLVCAVEPNALLVLAGSRSAERMGLRAEMSVQRDEIAWLSGDDLGGSHALLEGTPGLEGALAEHGLRQVHVRPLVALARVVGVLLVCDREPHALAPPHAELLGHLAPLLAAHIGFARQLDATDAADAALDDLYDASPNMLCTLDPLGRVRRTNKRFRDEIGVPDDVVGMPLSWLVHPAWLERYTQLWGRISRHERVAHARVDLVTTGFARLPMSLEAHWLPDQPVCMVALWNISNELERAASDRRRIDDLTAFAHHIAHDLKAPLRTISGFTELLLDELPDGVGENAGEYAERIQSSIERSARLIDGVLRFSKGTALEGESVPVQLRDLVTNVRSQLRADIDGLGGEIEVVADETPLLGQPVALAALLTNLISNALRYSTGVPRRVEVAVRIDEPGWAVLSVRDYGVGIAADDLEAVFELFTRRATDEVGSGVGLSIVRRIADAHGGEVTVRSVVGQGSTFVVQLPTP